MYVGFAISLCQGMCQWVTNVAVSQILVRTLWHGLILLARMCETCWYHTISQVASRQQFMREHFGGAADYELVLVDGDDVDCSDTQLDDEEPSSGSQLDEESTVVPDHTKSSADAGPSSSSSQLAGASMVAPDDTKSSADAGPSGSSRLLDGSLAAPFGDPEVFDDSQPFGDPEVLEDLQPFGDPEVSEDSQPFGDPEVFEDSQPCGGPSNSEPAARVLKKLAASLKNTGFKRAYSSLSLE